MKFINREISWLSFNERVLQEAEDSTNPLIERLKFLGIFSNNLDEFFRVRVASLTRLTDLGRKTKAKLVDDPAEILELVGVRIKELQNRRDKVYQDIMTDLKAENISFIDHTEIPEHLSDQVKEFFYQTLRPKLVPIILNRNTEFPELDDSSVYLLVKLELLNDNSKYALLEVPQDINRFFVLKDKDGYKVLYIEDIIRYRLEQIFRLFEIKSAEAFMIKITRDAELDLDDDFSQSLLAKMEKSVKKRKKGSYVRLIYDANIYPDILEFLKLQINVKGKSNVLAGGKYHNRKDLMSFPRIDRPELYYEPLPPLRHRLFKNQISLLAAIEKEDVLLHMPYHRFDYVTAVLREAAIDEYVKSISITLYRLSKNSDIKGDLVNAAKNGKTVKVIIELQARFDEENNIKYSDILQEAGAEVIFGAPGLKVHSKMFWIERRKNKVTTSFGYVGTGNFHEDNAKIYEDLGILTINPEITKELKKLFSLFDNAFQRMEFSSLIVSPFDSRNRFSELILNEIMQAQKGQEASIFIKLNNLVDRELIHMLYEASKAGVKIRIIVRGICRLIPGLKNLSENIEVRSIVGRFLEHSRILKFNNSGKMKIYISSADWMGRNLDRRIELTVPVLNNNIAIRLSEYLALQWTDNCKARKIDKAQTNEKFVEGTVKINSQLETYKRLKKELK